MSSSCSPRMSAFALAAMLLSPAALFAPLRSRAQSMEPPYAAASGQRRHAPSQSDINDCSQWATTATGFNPGPNKMPPGWNETKPRSESAKARYNRWMGLCLGQRELPAN